MIDLVRHYSSFAHHRTGTANDLEVIDWLAALLRNDGAGVDIDRWSFPQWTAHWSAELDGQPIDALPTFYEVSDCDDVRVVASTHPSGRLYVSNRHPVAESVPYLTMIVAGRHAARVDDVVARIERVHITDGLSANVRAMWPGAGPKVTVATPMSGWFSCASERGTGIAVARHLARELAAEGRQVELLCTSGHELFNIGLTREFEGRVDADGETIVHVGASAAAAGRGPSGLSELLAVTTNVENQGRRLAELGYVQRVGGREPKDWIGEARQWQSRGLPLLSVAGASEWFHTPDDVVENSTSADLLDLVADAFLHDVREFVGG